MGPGRGKDREVRRAKSVLHQVDQRGDSGEKNKGPHLGDATNDFSTRGETA